MFVGLAIILNSSQCPWSHVHLCYKVYVPKVSGTMSCLGKKKFRLRRITPLPLNIQATIGLFDGHFV